MTDDDIAKARDVIAAASKAPKVWGTIAGDTQADVIPRIVENYTNNPGVRAHVVAMQDGDTPLEAHCLTMAITGNGPTSEANAKYIVCSFDPVAGWSAALDEVERLRAEISVRNGLADAAGKAIYALETQGEQARAEISLLTADCAKWQAIGREASKTLEECGVTLDRVATIASEAFGPFPVQGVEANLTAIEHGIAAQKREVERLRAENRRLLELAHEASSAP